MTRLDAMPPKLKILFDLVLEQAEDEALWAQAESIVEAYTQQELRRLHSAVEGLPEFKAYERDFFRISVKKGSHGGTQ